jgi:nitrate/TMAO reductase-like tetraheme cytochrome c subunit
MKRCPICEKQKPFDEFYKNRTKRDGLQSQCKACHNSDRRKATPEQRRRNKLKTRYGISVEDYERLLAKQGGGCAICEKPPTAKRRLAVDHCHGTKRVRGLLCVACNRGIGYLGDDIQRLERALKYLKRETGHSRR